MRPIPKEYALLVVWLAIVTLAIIGFLITLNRLAFEARTITLLDPAFEIVNAKDVNGTLVVDPLEPEVCAGDRVRWPLEIEPRNNGVVTIYRWIRTDAEDSARQARTVDFLPSNVVPLERGLRVVDVLSAPTDALGTGDYYVLTAGVGTLTKLTLYKVPFRVIPC